MTSKTTLETRVINFVIMEEHGHFSMAMMIGLMDCLARSYGVPKKDVYDLMDKHSKLITKDNSDVEVYLY